MGNYKYMAVFMIMLILFIPVYSASVFAGIQNAYAHGQDNVPSFVRGTDTLSIYSRVVSSDNLEVPGFVRAVEDSVLTVDGLMICTSLGASTFGCEYEYGTERTMNPAESWYVYLCNNTATCSPVETLGTAAATFTVDAEAPTVDSLILTLTDFPYHGTDNISIGYSVTDPGSGCSGIRSVTFGTSENTEAEAEYMARSSSPLYSDVLDTSDCSPTTTPISWNPSSYYGLGRVHNVFVCAVATDRVSNANRTCSNFTLDTRAPSFIETYFESGDNRIAYLPLGGVSNAVLVAEMTESGAGFDSSRDVYANGTVLTGTVQAGTCTNDSTTWACRWTGLTLTAGTTSVDIFINATDDVGNSAAQTFTISFGTDTQDPNATTITTDANGYIGKHVNNTIVAILEDDNGVVPGSVTLTASDLSYNGSAVTTAISPTGCDSTTPATPLQCWWEDLVCSGSCASPGGTVDVTITAQDVAAQSITQSASLPKDFEAPSPVTDVSQVNQAGDSFFKTGDTITLSFNVTEDKSGGVTVSANFSDLNMAGGITSSACTDKGNNLWECSLSVTVDMLGYLDETITFTLEDALKNLGSTSTQVNVYEYNWTFAPNYYTLVIPNETQLYIYKPFLSGTDSVYTHYVISYLQMKQGAPCTDAEIYNIHTHGTAGECSEIKLSAQKYDDVSYMVGIDIFLDVGYVDWDYLIIDRSEKNYCNLSFRVRCDNKLFEQPEEEAILLNIPIVDDEEFPYDAGEALEEEINEIITRTDSDWWNTITTLDNWMGYGQSICGITGIMSKLFLALGLIQFGLNLCTENVGAGVGTFGISTAACASALAVVKGTHDTSRAGFTSILLWLLNQMCGIVMCTATNPLGLDTLLEKFPLIGPFLSDFLTPDVPGGWMGEIQGLLPEGYSRRFGDSPLELARRSWVASISGLCLPGILYHLNAMRQVECWKGVCYRDFTTINVPKSACDQQFEYLICVNGLSFNKDLLATELSNMLFMLSPLDEILQLISNPFAAVWVLFREGFNNACTATGELSTGTASSCIPYGIMLFIEAYSQAKQMIETENLLSPQQANWCEILYPQTEEEDTGET